MRAARRQEDEQLAREKQEAVTQAAKKAAEQEARATPQSDGQQHRRGGSEVDYGIDSPPHGHPTTMPSKPAKSKIAQSATTRLTPTPASSRAAKKLSGTPNIHSRASNMMEAVREVVLSMSRSLQTNPMILLRTLMFLVGLLLALSRRDVRDRIRRVTASGWGKVKATVGMGVKVSYI